MMNGVYILDFERLFDLKHDYDVIRSIKLKCRAWKASCLMVISAAVAITYLIKPAL